MSTLMTKKCKIQIFFRITQPNLFPVLSIHINFFVNYTYISCIFIRPVTWVHSCPSAPWLQNGKQCFRLLRHEFAADHYTAFVMICSVYLALSPELLPDLPHQSMFKINHSLAISVNITHSEISVFFSCHHMHNSDLINCGSRMNHEKKDSHPKM